MSTPKAPVPEPPVNSTHHLVYRDGQAARCAYCHLTGVSSQDRCPQAPK